jgi:hypothetical protein
VRSAPFGGVKISAATVVGGINLKFSWWPSPSVTVVTNNFYVCSYDGSTTNFISLPAATTNFTYQVAPGVTNFYDITAVTVDGLESDFGGGPQWPPPVPVTNLVLSWTADSIAIVKSRWVDGPWLPFTNITGFDGVSPHQLVLGLSNLPPTMWFRSTDPTLKVGTQ